MPVITIDFDQVDRLAPLAGPIKRGLRADIAKHLAGTPYAHDQKSHGHRMLHATTTTDKIDQDGFKPGSYFLAKDAEHDSDLQHITAALQHVVNDRLLAYMRTGQVGEPVSLVIYDVEFPAGWRLLEDPDLPPENMAAKSPDAVPASFIRQKRVFEVDLERFFGLMMENRYYVGPTGSYDFDNPDNYIQFREYYARNRREDSDLDWNDAFFYSFDLVQHALKSKDRFLLLTEDRLVNKGGRRYTTAVLVIDDEAVSLKPGLRQEVQKHLQGRHDQKTHGRRTGIATSVEQEEAIYQVSRDIWREPVENLIVVDARGKRVFHAIGSSGTVDLNWTHERAMSKATEEYPDAYLVVVHNHPDEMQYDIDEDGEDDHFDTVNTGLSLPDILATAGYWHRGKRLGEVIAVTRDYTYSLSLGESGEWPDKQEINQVWQQIESAIMDSTGLDPYDQPYEWWNEIAQVQHEIVGELAEHFGLVYSRTEHGYANQD